jgi:SulP family sulfate permease
MPGYSRRAFRSDVVAGLTVAAMLVPQSMAYALLAGLPPTYGLYASVAPLLIYAVLGTSLHLAVGVIAIDMLILRAGLSGFAEPGTMPYIELAILLAVLVGSLQIAMGLARVGFLVSLLSRPVMVGFTSGAALIIALSQVNALTGIDPQGGQDLPFIAWATARNVEQFRVLPLVVGGFALAALILLRRWKPVLPGALVLVALGTLIVLLLGPERAGVEVIGAIPPGLPSLSMPSLGGQGPNGPGLVALLPTAGALALVQFLTVVSLGKVFATRFRYRVVPNRELVAIGAANVVGGLFQGVPVSGSFSRTAVNADVGAKTPMSNVVAAVAVALCLLFLSPVLALVPVPVLGAVIIIAALGLLDVDEMRFMLKVKSVDGWIAVLTFGATVLTGIMEGILVGVLASLAIVLYRLSRPNAVVLGHLAGTRSFRDITEHPDARTLDGILILRIDASFSFMNAEYLMDLILARTRDAPGSVRVVVLDASSVNDLDTTAAHVLWDVKDVLDQQQVRLLFGGVKDRVMRVLARSGLLVALGEDSFFLSPHRAVRHVLTEWGISESYLRQVPGGMERWVEADP